MKESILPFINPDLTLKGELLIVGNSNSLLNFRINNLTDETYEQVSGYPGLPRLVFIGLDYQF